jgi:hypothetical protein
MLVLDGFGPHRAALIPMSIRAVGCAKLCGTVHEFIRFAAILLKCLSPLTGRQRGADVHFWVNAQLVCNSL